MQNIVQSEKCYNITGINKEKNHIVLRMEQEVSWDQAQKICKDIGLLLPYFPDREKLNEFIAIFKLTRALPPLEGVFIGLSYSKLNKEQV